MIKLKSYEYHSPSRLNLFCACPSMFTYQYVLGNTQNVGPPAHRGTAVEAGLAYGLEHPEADLDACKRKALNKFDALMALSGDPRYEEFRATIPGMVAMALPRLRPYGVPSGMQGHVEWKPDELEVPVIGYYDFEWEKHGIIADLKTTQKMPSEIKVPHARQIAFYTRTDNADARIFYVTPKRMETYQVENLGAHRRSLLQIAQSVERYLSLSDDPQFYKAITMPDVESFYWSSPENRAIAYREWGV